MRLEDGRSRRLVVAACTLLALSSLSGDATAGEQPSPPAGDKLVEVGQIALGSEGLFNDRSGWMILSPASRRGYTLVEGGNQTVIESFDLDTLTKRQRAVIPGLTIPAGAGSGGAGNATASGEIVHAVDSEEHRIYIPISNTLSTGQLGQDEQRMLSYVLVLDEAQFDVSPDRAFGAFALPGDQQRLQAYPLNGMAVAERPGANVILAVFASRYPLSSVNGTSIPGPYDHTLVQWNPAMVETEKAPPASFLTPGALPVEAGWDRILTSCATGSLTSPGGSEASAYGAKNLQVAILPAKDAIFLACQSAPMSGAVLRFAIDPATGAPLPGLNQQLISLGKPVGDSIADIGGGRLYLRSFGGGATWWAFDSATLRFAGSIAGNLADGVPMATGVDPGSGRLYTLTPDTCVPRQGGGQLPVRGGLKAVEARLDPVPAAENVRPDLAYNSWWRIQVDPVTQRIFARLGITEAGLQDRFPECNQDKREEAPVEPFYRVFEDRLGLAEPKSDLDDTQFTTNVAEQTGLTQASFLGSGQGYGSRLVLTGGIDALANGVPTTARSLCGRDDRELLIGSAGRVEVSDQSTSAESASLDADSRTREALGDPLSRCRPQAPPGPAEQLNRCGPDAREFALDDEAKDKNGNTIDGNEDGCPDRTGENRYQARCIQDDTNDATGPAGRTVKRDGFTAKANCAAAEDKADATSSGAIGVKEVDEFFETAGVAGDPLRIARSSSDVEVERKMGQGISVAVDSIARGIEIPGVGTIGVVRAEAKSTATGRDGRAKGTYVRTICDVRVGAAVFSGCTGDENQQKALVKQMNEALGGRGEVRLRQPDPALLDGTPHGYLAAVQRDRKQLFGDQSITRDRSLTVPALEIILFQGEGGAWGAGRQVIQLAGVQAATSYGIVCTYGQAPDGKCATADGTLLPPDAGPVDGGTTIVERTTNVEVPGPAVPGPERNIFKRILKAIPAAAAEALRLLFNNPRELGLMAAVWGLLYAPCYLGERRRTITGLRARRVTGVPGGAG